MAYGVDVAVVGGAVADAVVDDSDCCEWFFLHVLLSLLLML